MKAVERAVIAPEVKIIMQRRARRQVLRNRPPLAACAQDIHQPVDQRAIIDMPPIAAALGRPNQRRDTRPFGVRDIAGVAQLAAVIARTIFVRPYRRSTANQENASESQAIQITQFVSGQTLR